MQVHALIRFVSLEDKRGERRSDDNKCCKLDSRAKVGDSTTDTANHAGGSSRRGITEGGSRIKTTTDVTGCLSLSGRHSDRRGSSQSAV